MENNEKPTMTSMSRFFEIVEAIKKSYNGDSRHGQHTVSWYVEMGCNKATLDWLKKNHYVTWHTKGEKTRGKVYTNDTDVCIMYKNPLYPERNYYSLKALYEEVSEK